MLRLAIAVMLSAAIALPAAAQKKDEPKKDAPKVAIPKDTFFKGQTAGQYLAGDQLIGAKVTNKDGQTIGTISDLIVGAGEKIEGVVLGVGGFLGVGEKKIGVRVSALKITRSDGRLVISLPIATKEMLTALEPYQRAGAPAKK